MRGCGWGSARTAGQSGSRRPPGGFVARDTDERTCLQGPWAVAAPAHQSVLGGTQHITYWVLRRRGSRRVVGAPLTDKHHGPHERTGWEPSGRRAGFLGGQRHRPRHQGRCSAGPETWLSSPSGPRRVREWRSRSGRWCIFARELCWLLGRQHICLSLPVIPTRKRQRCWGSLVWDFPAGSSAAPGQPQAGRPSPGPSFSDVQWHEPADRAQGERPAPDRSPPAIGQL